MLCDLHIHTTASDGTWTPSELIEQALAKKLGAIAVTDHDSIDNVAETQALARRARIKFLPGSELCSTKENICFHILGYGIDINDKNLTELLAHNTALLEAKDVESIALLEREGWDVSTREFADYNYDRRRGGWRALAYLIDKKLCTDVNDFFKRIFTPEHALGFPSFPSIDEVIKIIHGAGGVAICAHAASGFHGPGLARVMKLLTPERFDGFECYHSSHSAEETKFLLEHCRKNNLLISGGSDCHGEFIPSRQLGEPRVEASNLFLPGLL